MNNKKRKATLEAYSKIKEDTFDFDQIAKYKSPPSKEPFKISSRTFQDLDFNEFFMFLDRTSSKVGQQYLYEHFQIIPNNEKCTVEREKRIENLNENSKVKEECILALSNLSQREALYLTSLFQEKYLTKPKWFLAIQLSAVLSIVTFIAAFFVPALWIAMVFILIINFIIHYWNKRNLYEYGASLPQLSILVQSCKKISSLLKDGNAGLHKSILRLTKLNRVLSVFKLEASIKSDASEIAEYILEMLKALFLIEPILLFYALRKLEDSKEHIRTLFEYIGKIDMCLSIDALRKTSNLNCRPIILSERETMVIEEVYHPLLSNPVNNSVDLKNKSVLLTGSNMSGKTTFIRTVGINAILGQSMNICFAKSFQMPRINVHSTIRITDDLMDDKSYYFQEVLEIKTLLEASESTKPNLFLLDELFKGTNTLERIASGKAVLSHLTQKRNIVFIATHDLELTTYLSQEYKLYHFSEDVEGESIQFDYKLKQGNLNKTNAIRILEVNGYPSQVIKEARNMVNRLQSQS